MSNLEPRHHQHLLSEGFSESDIAFMQESRKVRSVSHNEARQMGFSVESGGGLLLPFTPSFAQLRCDNPPTRKGKLAKYLTQSGKGSKAYLPDGVKVITEGLKDALAGSLRGGVATGALAGVSHYKKALHQNCGYTILFDADGWQNPSVFAALVSAARWCNGKIQLVPEIAGQPKAGLCEYFKSGKTSDDYEKLVKSALTPKQFLLELPKRWRSMPIDKVSKALRTLFSLGCTVLDPTSLEQLSQICKAYLKPLGITAAAVKSEYKSALSQRMRRIQAERLKERAKRWAENPEIDLTDVKEGSESQLLCTLLAVKRAVGKNLRLNQLRNQLEYRTQPVDPNTYRLFVSNLTDIDCPESDCAQILGTIGKKQAYHPVKQWFETLESKHGTTTIGYLQSPASTYLHTSDPLYNTFLRKQMIAAVARIYEPGCKVDTCVILQGSQGLGKSTFWNKLSSDEWFDDNLGSDVENKDELLKLHRTWFEEWGEIDRITSKKELGLVKSFLSRKVDTFRAPYERAAVEHQRACVIVGSVNPTEFLRDEEDRRLCIIPITQKIDIEAVERDRDSLWAAAVALYKAGEKWWLDPEEENQQRESNKQFAIRDAWEDQVEDWLSNPANTHSKGFGTSVLYVRVQDILTDCLEIKEVSRHDGLLKKRVQDILRRLGWEANKTAVRLSSKSKPQRVWSKSTIEPELSITVLEPTPEIIPALSISSSSDTSNDDLELEEDEVFEFFDYIEEPQESDRVLVGSRT